MGIRLMTAKLFRLYCPLGHFMMTLGDVCADAAHRLHPFKMLMKSIILGSSFFLLPFVKFASVPYMRPVKKVSVTWPSLYLGLTGGMSFPM